MRERLARVILILTFAVVVGLSALFATRHNQPTSRPINPRGLAESSEPTPTVAQIAQGRSVFEQQKCSTCHSIAGAGNGRYPLDGVAEALTGEELRRWTTGTGVAATELSAGVKRRKQRFQSLAEDDMAALVAYLSTLKEL